MWQQLYIELRQSDTKSLSRCISLVENEIPGYDAFLKSLPTSNQKITGITGPPGAGKSTLVDGIINQWIAQGKKVAVLCIDPSSPFNYGALLGDRIRMSDWYTNPNVFIRSLSSRGSLGGLNPKIIEISEVIKAADFDEILIETVGVGQSEVEIAGLSDTTIVVLVPEAGDEVQTMKAGLMEIADIFVVNKADRPDAAVFTKNLRFMLAPAFSTKKIEIPIIKTVASRQEGISELVASILHHQQINITKERKYWLLAEKAWQLLQNKRMYPLNKKELFQNIEKLSAKTDFNLYQFVADVLKNRF